jgi:hypothetical protein
MRSQFTGNFVPINGKKYNWKDGKKDERRHVKKYVDRQKKEISEVVIEFAKP